MLMNCPSCGAGVEFPPESAGSATPCPTCQTQIILQAPADPAAMPEAIPAQSMPVEPQPLDPTMQQPMMPGVPAPVAPEMPAAPMGIPVPELTPGVPERPGAPLGELPQPEIPKVISPAPPEAPLEEIPLESAFGGPSLPPLPGGEEMGDLPIIKPGEPLPAEDAVAESRQEAMEELVEKYDTDEDGQLSIEELEEVRPEDQDKVDEVLVDYPALKAQLDALLEKKQSRVAAETQAESKRREAEEAMASLEIRRKEEIQTTEQALTKAASELQRLNSEIADLENSEQTRKEKDEAEAKAREENKVREEGRYNNQIRTKEVERLDVDDKSKLLEEELTNLHSKEEARRNQFDEERKALEKRQETDERRYKEQVKLHEDTLAQAKNVHKRLGSEEEKLIEGYTSFRDKQERGERERNLNQAKESARFEKAVASRKTAIDRFEHDSKVLEEELGEVREKDRIRKRLAAEEARRKQQAEIEEREIDVLKAEEEAQKIADTKLEVAKEIKGAEPEVESSVPRPGGPKKPKPPVKPPLPPSKLDSSEDSEKEDDAATTDLPPLPEPDLSDGPTAPPKTIEVKLLDDDDEGDAPALPPLHKPGDAKVDLPELPAPPLPSVSVDAPKLPDLPKPPSSQTGRAPKLPDLPKLPRLPKPPGGDAPDSPKPLGASSLPKPPGASGLPKPPSLPELSDASDPLLPPPSGEALEAEKKVIEASLQRAADKRAAMLREEEEAKTPPPPKPPGGPPDLSKSPGGAPDLPKSSGDSALPPLPKPPGGPPDLSKSPGGAPDLPKSSGDSALPPLPKPPGGAPDLPKPLSGAPDLPKPPEDSALPLLPKPPGDAPAAPSLPTPPSLPIPPSSPTPPSTPDALPPLPAPPGTLEGEARQQTLDDEKKAE